MLSFSVRTHSAVCSGLQWIARTFPILSICRLHEMWIHTFSVYCERVLEWFRVLMLHSESWSQLIFSTSKYFSDELLTEHYGSMEGKKHSHASSVFRNRQIRKSASFIRNQMILSIYFQNRAWLRTQDALYSYSSQRQGYYYEKWNNAKKIHIATEWPPVITSSPNCVLYISIGCCCFTTADGFFSSSSPNRISICFYGANYSISRRLSFRSLCVFFPLTLCFVFCQWL